MYITHTTTIERKVANFLADAPNISECFTDVRIEESATGQINIWTGIERDLVDFTATADIEHWIKLGEYKEKYRLLGVFQVSSWVEDEFREMVAKRLSYHNSQYQNHAVTSRKCPH